MELEEKLSATPREIPQGWDKKPHAAPCPPSKHLVVRVFALFSPFLRRLQGTSAEVEHVTRKNVIGSGSQEASHFSKEGRQVADLRYLVACDFVSLTLKLSGLGCLLAP